MPIEYAYASRAPVGDSETYGFNSVEKLVVGTTYYVSLRVTTTGFYRCSIYDQNGCSWIEPTDYIYQWTFLFSGAIYTYGTPFYTPENSTVVLRKGPWLKGKKAAKFSGSSTLSPSCLCRPVTLEGLAGGRWVPLKSFAEFNPIKVKIPYKYKQIRLSTAPVSVVGADGGTRTTTAATSTPLRVPKKPKRTRR